jgi:hypothetical protein
MDTNEYTYTTYTSTESKTGVGELRRLAATLRTHLAVLEEALREVEEPLPIIEMEE